MVVVREVADVVPAPGLVYFAALRRVPWTESTDAGRRTHVHERRRSRRGCSTDFHAVVQDGGELGAVVTGRGTYADVDVYRRRGARYVIFSHNVK